MRKAGKQESVQLVSGLQKIGRIMHQIMHGPDCPCQGRRPRPRKREVTHGSKTQR
jgi:hypothetical protein